MENFFIKRKFIKNSNGAFKYGFFEALRNKHKFPIFFLPTNDWAHGWTFFNSDIIINYRAKLSHKIGFVVPTENLKNTFKKYTNNKIILDSLPFYYFCKNILCDYKFLNNDNNNLLVFPAKIPFSGQTQNEIKLQKNYFDYIKSLEKSFEKIFICIPYQDSFNEDYTKILKKINLSYFTGASPSDSNSYIRLLQIFSLAKYFTTNTVGSGLVYAGILNKKISISGPIYVPNRTLENLYIPKDFEYSINQLAEEYKRIESKEFIQNNFSNLIFSNPILAKENYDWAYNEIGGKYFISSEKACINLGLNYRSQFRMYLSRFI
jgi:hypothetical protein